MTRFVRTRPRWIVLIAFVLFAKRYVRYRRCFQWILPVSSDGRYVDSAVTSDGEGYSLYLRKDQAVVFAHGQQLLDVALLSQLVLKQRHSGDLLVSHLSNLLLVASRSEPL